MSTASATRKEFGEGPLARAAALVYSLLVLEVLLVLGAAPGLVLLGLLDRDASNVPLAALCALPAGPAWSAALYAWHHRSRDLTELHPARAYRRGYRAAVPGVFTVWAPWLAAMALICTVLTHRDAAGVPGWWMGLLLVVAVVSALWVTNALVITSLFTFKAVDTARLAAYFLVKSFRATVGNLCVLAAAVAVTAAGAQVLPLLLASVVAAGTLLNSRPMITEIREEFTA
ncbi:hypothetical protein NMG29_05390 [Streptomyces cocklensis]|uniref:DUF624 domain-containing protein n=1 Tax=Actinacidiphila cocklensis TaxID=887465 RepID=A0A9W4GX40_9ACTN|nr:hypothetical protein [Actinacidiphila cocklensis]MDD1057665.1 hypothetical protein [Actinacidiphila cocklensis]CAG6398365.1 conserved membrane hypothetical protein [Actinacidiphila cocklensis]